MGSASNTLWQVGGDSNMNDTNEQEQVEKYELTLDMALDPLRSKCRPWPALK
jgi:hypothetical protein